MRNLKFRAWDKEDGIFMWFTLSDIQYLKNVIKYSYPVTQFVGLKDKNKNDIYDGDMIFIEEYTHPDGRHIKRGNYKVSYLGSGFGLIRDEGFWSLDDFPFSVFPEPDIVTNVEVIGHKYQSF